jgi:hypothetical protein
MLKNISRFKWDLILRDFPIGPDVRKRSQKYSDEKIIALPGFDADSNKNRYSK